MVCFISIVATMREWGHAICLIPGEETYTVEVTYKERKISNKLLANGTSQQGYT